MWIVVQSARPVVWFEKVWAQPLPQPALVWYCHMAA